MEILKIKTYNFDDINLVKKDNLYFINYNKAPHPKIQLPIFTVLNNNCIPPPNSKYYKSDIDRAFLKVSVNEESVLDFFNSYNTVIKEIVNKKSLIYYPNITDSTIKLKLNVQDDKITTLLYDENKKIIEYKDLDELSSYIKKDTELRIIVFPSKVWTMNKNFGLHFKVYAIQIISQPLQRQISQEAIFNSDSESN